MLFLIAIPSDQRDLLHNDRLCGGFCIEAKDQPIVFIFYDSYPVFSYYLCQGGVMRSRWFVYQSVCVQDSYYFFYYCLILYKLRSDSLILNEDDDYNNNNPLLKSCRQTATCYRDTPNKLPRTTALHCIIEHKALTRRPSSQPNRTQV